MATTVFTKEEIEKIKGYGRPAAGWFCTYTPLELIEAAGLTPVRISGPHGPTSMGDSLMHTNICPFIKSLVDEFESGNLDFLDAVVFTSGCDAQRRLYDIIKNRKPDIPVFLLQVPKKDGDEDIKRFAAELENLKKWLEQRFIVEIDDKRLIDAMDLYRYLRARIRGFDGARRRQPPKITGSRVMEVMLQLLRMPAEKALAFLDEEEKKIRWREIEAGPSVLLYGNMLDDPGFPRLIEEYGGHVLMDDTCSSRRFWAMPQPKPEPPFLESLARSYLTKSPCARMATKQKVEDKIKELVEQQNPDGVIIHVLKFCDTHMYDVPRLRKALESMNVQTLTIESDYTEASGQIATRVQAFIEMLGETRGTIPRDTSN